GMNVSDRAVLFDAKRKTWLAFHRPSEIVEIHSRSEVLPALNRIEARVEQEGLQAAGFVSYEAAPAFDKALKVHPDEAFPLLWFGLFERSEEVILPEPEACGPAEPIEWAPAIRREEYREAVRRIREHLLAGDTYQVNYSFRLRAEFAGNPWNLFLRMAKSQQGLYGAFLQTDRWAVLSASPEMFFGLDGEKAESKPMKGTAPRGPTWEMDQRSALNLKQSEKNRAENIMIVDMVRNDMGRIARLGSVRADALFEVEAYPTLWQMTSTVTCLTDASISGIFQALFPPSSVTGAPKPGTMKIIRDIEPHPRRIYCGAAGFILPGRIAQFNVAIRTVLVDLENHTAEYGVGSGVVWDSEAGDEYEECLLKAKILTRPFPSFFLLETLLWTPEEGYFLLDTHIARMAESAAYFSIPADPAGWREILTATAAGLPGIRHKVRLTVDRKGIPECGAERLPEPRTSGPVAVRLAQSSVDSTDPFLYHKTTHRAVYDNARAGRPGCEDVILWNERDEVTESTIANIVFESDGGLWTPPVSSGLLAGTYRGWMLSRGLIRERVLPVDELRKCSRILLVNSVQGEREAVLTGD
ncbi:aminodeoxychorismate synthase component I, partial [bacterium]|nr:aminodeoxychorismate synthase component I [bacterium]